MRSGSGAGPSGWVGGSTIRSKLGIELLGSILETGSSSAAMSRPEIGFRVGFVRRDFAWGGTFSILAAAFRALSWVSVALRRSSGGVAYLVRMGYGAGITPSSRVARQRTTWSRRWRRGE